VKTGFLGRIRLSTVVLITIGVFDLVTTLMLLGLGMHEGNPFFAQYAQSPLALAATKILFLAGPIALLEFARKYSPRSAEQGTWVAAGAYFTLYVLHLIQYLIDSPVQPHLRLFA